MKICNMKVWVILSKPGSNNLYLKVPPSIGIGQQCINAFGYHGNGVATTYFRMATIHCIILCSCVYYCLTHPQPQNSCLCIEIGIACTHNGWKWTNNSDCLNKCKQTIWQCQVLFKGIYNEFEWGLPPWSKAGRPSGQIVRRPKIESW